MTTQDNRGPTEPMPMVPNFTVPGGAHDLTLSEYEEKIVQNPQVIACLDNIPIPMVVSGAVLGIGAHYYAQVRRYRILGRSLWSLGGFFLGVIGGSILAPMVLCSAGERRAINRATEILAYGPYRREDGKDSLSLSKDSTDSKSSH